MENWWAFDRSDLIALIVGLLGGWVAHISYSRVNSASGKATITDQRGAKAGGNMAGRDNISQK